jgi:GPH family glycoside/pentoside/hexuronide:cation symporter
MKTQVRLATKLAYGVGALTDSIKTFSFTTFLFFYYTTVLGLPGTLLGLAMSVGLVFDAAADPVIGHLSDSATLRFGRRHTFMLVGAVGAGGSFIAVFNVPPGLSTAQLFAWLMAWTICLRSSISLFVVPYMALGAELSADYHERTSISAYRSGAAIAGTLLATAAAFLVFLPNESRTGGVDAKFVRDGYGSMGIAFGLAIAFFGVVATVGTLRDRDRIASQPGSEHNALALQPALLAALRDPSFRIIVLSSALGMMAAAINAALAMHFLTYHARISASGAITLYFGAFYAGAFAGVIIWVRVTQWFEKHHVLAATTLVTAFVMSAGYWLVGEGRPFGTGYLPILMIGNGLAGFFGIAGAMIIPSMIADITAQDELRTGRRREGIFFGIHSFGLQLSAGFAVLIAGVLMDRFAKLVPGQAEQSVATVDHLAMISNVVPAVIMACGGVLAVRYGLTRRKVESIQVQLAGLTNGTQAPVER